MNKEVVLSRIPLFENLSRENKSALADICLPKKLKKGEMLFFEGDKGYSVYILVKGNIQLFKSTPKGRESVIKIVKAGELFAEVVLFEENRYPVSGMALSESFVFVIPRHQFVCLLENRNFRDEFIGNLMQKLRYLADRIQYLIGHDMEERLFMFLEEQYGKAEHIVSTLTKKDVAAAIGTTPETLSRLLLRLKNDDRLHWEGSTIRINTSEYRNPKREKQLDILE